MSVLLPFGTRLGSFQTSWGSAGRPDKERNVAFVVIPWLELAEFMSRGIGVGVGKGLAKYARANRDVRCER